MSNVIFFAREFGKDIPDIQDIGIAECLAYSIFLIVSHLKPNQIQFE